MKRLHTFFTSGKPSNNTYCEACLAKALEAEPLEINEHVSDLEQDYEFPYTCIDCGEK